MELPAGVEWPSGLVLAHSQHQIYDAKNGIVWPDMGETHSRIHQSIELGDPWWPDRDAPPIARRIDMAALEAMGPTPWVVDGYLAAQSITLLAAAPKAGKSTMVGAMMGHAVYGGHFLGRRIDPGSWWLFTEEGQRPLRNRLDRQALLGDQVHRYYDGPYADNDQAARLVEYIRGELDDAHSESLPDVIVIDTLAHWMLGGVDVNDMGEVRKALRPIHDLQSESGAAILLVHQLRKGGGGAEAILGSTQFRAAFDINLTLQRNFAIDGGFRLDCESRIAEGWSTSGYFDWPSHTYHITARAERLDYLYQMLDESDDKRLRTQDFRAQWSNYTDAKKPTQQNLHGTLKNLVEDGKLVEEREGGKVYFRRP